MLKRAVASAKLGQGDRLGALERLDRQARAAEAAAETGDAIDLLRFLEAERRASARLGGRAVGGPDAGALTPARTLRET